MRILYITLENISLHKGSVIHILEVIEGLRSRGHFVRLVAHASDDSQSNDKFYNLKKIPDSILNLFRLKRQPYIISSLFLFIFLIKNLQKYDVIYARDYHTVIIAFLPRVLLRKSLVLEINGLASEEQKLKGNFAVSGVVSHCIKIAERIATISANQIIVVTPQIKEYLIRHYYCDEEKVKIVSNGVDTKKFFPMENKAILESIKMKYGLEKSIIVGFVGNLAPWQGVEILIHASRLLRNDKIKFLIVGDGISKEKLINKAKELNVTDRFVFTGVVNYADIPTFINIADICVLPKLQLKSGYSPIKLYEYMACGKPILSSRVDGLEFIEKEEIGILVNPGDAANLAKNLLELLVNSELREKMGQRAVKLAREKFDWSLKVNEIEKIIEETISK